MKTEKNPTEKIIKERLNVTGKINDKFFVETPRGTLHIYTVDKMFKEEIKMSIDSQQKPRNITEKYISI